MHADLVPPPSIDGIENVESAPWKTEFDVLGALREMGHEVHVLGVQTDLGKIRRAIDEFRPHITFNLLQEFHGLSVYDHSVVSYLELLKHRYTGCNPRGLMLAQDKALSKKILSYHRIPAPDFGVFPVGQRVRRRRKLGFPLIVKSLTEDASLGISLASVVHTDAELEDRVAFIHNKVGTDAIAESFIEGRELYVGILGNQRLRTFPIWELLITKAPADRPLVATEKIKWDPRYQKKMGVITQAAEGLSEPLEKKILHVCKRAYRRLNLSGYARLDLRLSEEGNVYIIEANPNPDLSCGEDYAASAKKNGISYRALIERILRLGLRYRAHWDDQGD